MGITIEQIGDNEHFEYKGDVHITGNVGKNATIIIKDGSLSIDGNVDNQTEINLKQDSTSSVVISSGMFNNISIGGSSSARTLNITGNVGNGVIIKSHNAEYSITGDVGNQCNLKTHNGDIHTGNVGEGTTLLSHNGDVSSGNVNKNSSLKTHNGEVTAKIMAESTSAISHNGDVRVVQAHGSAQLQSNNGNIYENGVKRKKNTSQSSGVTSFSIGNMSFHGGVGRIIVNGQDITNVVNNAANNTTATPTNEQPYRYTKG